MRLTILFDSPYWIGLLEDERDGFLYAARYIFGAEPSDQQVYAFVQHDLLDLTAQMTVGLPIETAERHPVNPKRMQREVRRELSQTGVTTKAQEAMRLQIESRKRIRREDKREQRDALRDHKRAVAREKARAKHRGH